MQYLNDKEFLLEFGRNLKKIRLNKSLTQKDVAYTIGIEISQISRIERGVLNTSIVTCNEIAKALNIELKELFDF